MTKYAPHITLLLTTALLFAFGFVIHQWEVHMKLRAIKLLFWLWFKTHGYYLWSKLWRLILERQYRGPIGAYSDVIELERSLQKLQWRSDPLNGLLDYVSKPERVEMLLWLGHYDDRLDCDEYAIYAANVLKEIGHEAYFMSVTWFDQFGRFHGHNICAFKHNKRSDWAHISNWWGGQAMYLYQDFAAIAQDIIGPKSKLIGYAVATPDLSKLVKLHV